MCPDFGISPFSKTFDILPIYCLADAAFLNNSCLSRIGAKKTYWSTFGAMCGEQLI